MTFAIVECDALPLTFNKRSPRYLHSGSSQQGGFNRFDSRGPQEDLVMKTVLTALISATTAAVVATLVVVAIADNPSPATTISNRANLEAPTDDAASPPITSRSVEIDTEPAEPGGSSNPALNEKSDHAISGIGFDPAAIFDSVGPSVVAIATDSGGGTGFFIDNFGHIATNFHVIQGFDEVLIADAAGNTSSGKVLGFDRANDLAIIRIDVMQLEVHAVTLANSDLADVGQWVAAIGSPFGLDQTLTTGVVSAIERTRIGATDRPQRGLIQTDAAINPGHSGGVLVNAQGEVLGIINSVESPIRGSVGVGFAIPVNVLARFLDQMIAGEQVSHPWIGIGVESSAQTGNLAIGTVIRGAPAELAGIQIGDRLLRIDDTALVEFEQLARLLDSYNVGDVVTFVIERNGSNIVVDIELGAWPG